MMRGSGAQMNDGDIVILAERVEDSYSIRLMNKKMKGGPRPKPMNLIGKLYPVDGLFDQHGVQITAPVFDWVEATTASMQPGQRLTSPQMEAAAKDTLAKEKIAFVQEALRSIFEERKTDRDNCYATQAIGPDVYDRYVVLANRQPPVGPDLDDEHQAMTAYLNKHSREDRPSPFRGMFKCIAIPGLERAQKRWFPQPATPGPHDAPSVGPEPATEEA
jgi:hypothetical protein